MSRKREFNCVFQVLDLEKNEVFSERLPMKSAYAKFLQCVDLSLSLGFSIAKEFRIVCGNHVLFQFRDIRSMILQNDLDYE